MNYYRILAGWFILFMNSSFIHTDSNCRSTIPPYEPLSDEQISKLNSSINLLSAQAYVGADGYIRCIIKIDPELTSNCDKRTVAKQCNSCTGALCPGCRDSPNKTCWNCWFRNGEKLPMQEPNKYDYDISQNHPSGQHLSQYYEFHLIIRNVTEKDAGYYNTELKRLCEYEGSYSNHSTKLTIKEPSFNCLQKTTMEVLDTKDEYYVDIFCSVEGAPHSHVQFLWFSEHGIIATDSEGECSYSNGLNITRRLRISRKRAERLKMIYCNVTNSLIKNRSCLYEAYISPIPDYTWSFIVSIILGSAILSVISVSIYLKATENRNLISMLETYIYIKKTNG